MGFSITDLISHINTNTPAKAHLYEVRIFGGGKVPDATPDITLNCSGITVPGVNLGFSQDSRYGIGQRKNFPISKSFTETNMTFYESASQKEREYFVNWINTIYNPETKRFGFYKDYVKTISILQYDSTGFMTYEAILSECWPSNVSPNDKGYALGEQVPQFNVNIQFYEVKEIHNKPLNNTSTPSLFNIF